MFSLSFSGFDNAFVFRDITPQDIIAIEEYVKKDLNMIFGLTTAHNDKCNRAEKVYIFGQFSSKPFDFMFLPDEKELIYTIADYINQTIQRLGESDGLGHFAESVDVREREMILTRSALGTIFGGSLEPSYIQMFCNAADTSSQPNTATTLSRTHNFLAQLKSIADRNVKREKEGYRFEIDVKSFATYIRILGGPLLYKTIQSNLELSLPSLDTTNRFIRQMDGSMVEGCLRTDELLKYLTDRHLPLVVAISEDATRIDGRIQFDARTNQISGFALPLNKTNGMPIPFSFPARNRDEILHHFSSATVAKFVNVVMAKPMANYPPFCLLLFSSDGKYTAEGVAKRWRYITNELSKADIKVLTIASDSDPRYNSAMRQLSLLGHQSNLFGESKWFCSGLDESFQGPFCIQDYIHIITKLRNLLLKTRNYRKKLPFGPNFHIVLDHLEFLLKHHGKDKHGMTPSTLDPVDKQNFSSAKRMYSDKVVDMLKEEVLNSDGTVRFLEWMRNVFNAFCDPQLLPLQRVEMIWNTVFDLRILRKYISSRNDLTLKHNFLTQNSYVCVEINAHSLVHLLLYLKENNLEEWFLPFFYDSQPCESFFRQIRSLSSVYSTVTNCSSKEIIERINRIQLLNEITHNTEFSFPHIKNSSESPNRIINLPTKEEIFQKISECQQSAIEYALEIGLLDSENSDFNLECELPSISLNTASLNVIDSTDVSKNKVLTVMARLRALAKAATLRNHAKKFIGKKVPETSSFVEIYNDSKRRMIVKKSSLCWLLRTDHGKLSSDRIYRVRGAKEKNCQKSPEIKNSSKRISSKRTVLHFNLKGKGKKMKLKRRKGNQEYEVESLLSHEVRNGKEFFLVKWKGFDESENSWEPRRNLHCKRILNTYLSTKRLVT